jgi:hypothetical protein
MQEHDKYGKIREKLLNAEVQAPDFETLLGKEVLEEASLRAVCASKLNEYQAEAPTFDAMFAGESLGKPVAVKKIIKLYPWWTIAFIAAACIVLIMLFPNPMKMNKGVYGRYHIQEKKLESQTPVQPKTFKFTPIKVLTEKLNAPSRLANLIIEKKQVPTPKVTSMEVLPEETAIVDTLREESLPRINPSNKSNLLPAEKRSVEEAYAIARIRKAKPQRDKMNIGANINGSNRLLSMVNSKTNGGFALSSEASSAGDGYSQLEGASSSLLRTATTSANEWQEVENFDGSIQDCITSYSLPINLGLTVSIPLFGNINLTTGLQYSYMANNITGNISTGKTFDLKQELHYLGIPVKISLNLVKRGAFVVYAAVGGTIEKGLAGIQRSTVDGEGSWEGTQSVYGLAASLIGQFGVSYDLKKNFLLYFEPGVAWYIPTDQPISNRTEEPFNLNLALGIRYNFQ